jgi:thioredoxin 2
MIIAERCIRLPPVKSKISSEQLINMPTSQNSATNISCPKCASTNRVPSDRLGDKPKCAKCKIALFQGKPIELTAANVATVLNHNEIPVLVDCWAPWCGPCKSFAPIFEQAAQQLEPKIRLAKLNTEDQQPLAGRWQIRSIPTLILFRAGKEVARVSGAMTLTQLKQWLAQNGVV